MQKLQTVLLISGIIASLLYVGSDIAAGLSWEGYSFMSQAVSELRGIGAPTREFLVPILTSYAILEIFFGFGIWRAAGKKRAMLIAGLLLISLGFLDLIAWFFSMDASKTVGSLVNTIHILLTVLTVFLLLLIIGFGAFVDGKWFRFYSFATLVIVILTGVWSFMDISQIAINHTAPFMGLKERISIYSYMLWLMILAIVLLHSNTQRRPSE